MGNVSNEWVKQYPDYFLNPKNKNNKFTKKRRKQNGLTDCT